MKDLLSPKQVARAIGVSESSLKRWCDQGLITAIRTAGGHRKLPLAEVMQFLRERQHKLVSPEILGMPARSEKSDIGLDHGCEAYTDALIQGNESLARQIVLDLFLARHSIAVICDSVISVAFHEIGKRWACNTVEVYQERRGCEITLRVLYELRRMQNEPEAIWNACGGTLEGDSYSVTTTMAEVVLRDAGWNATSLGSSIPVTSFEHAILENRPKLFWLSVSHIDDPERFVQAMNSLTKTTDAVGTRFALGGRALTPGLLKQLTYGCHCQSMQELREFGIAVRENRL